MTNWLGGQEPFTLERVQQKYDRFCGSNKQQNHSLDRGYDTMKAERARMLFGEPAEQTKLSA